ncbi:MAG TPA: thioredoxin domain-containing protein [Blastocatellia bacterium]|nr:thioredoxin domain-containing protein [Blastocatellia bacterium]
MKKLSLVFFVIILACSVVAQTKSGATTGKAPQKAAPAKPAPAPAAAAKQTPASQQAQPAAKKEEDCGCEAKTPPPDVLAIVNGVKITIKEVDEQIKPRIEEIQKQVIEARNRELDLQINSKLLEAEAKRRGISSAKLLDEEIIAKTKEPTEAEAKAFYDQNKDRIQDSYDAVKTQIIGYLRELEQRDLAKAFAERLRATAQVKKIVESVTPPQTDADRARVLATVNGQPITSGDIEDSLQPLIFEVQEQIYEMRKQQLDMRINDALLEQEAQKRKVTTTALFETEVKAKAKPVTEEDAKKFYDENKDRIQGSYEQVKPQVISYLETRGMNKAESDYADQLRKAASVQVFLTEPEPPVLKIATDDQPSKGSATAPVTIVEFTDYECPSCANAQPILEEVIKEYGDKVRLVARDFPLDQHTHALKAAEAAEAAREQGKYWEYTALLFKNQKALEVERLKEYATQVGLDRAKFDQALDTDKYLELVQRDMADGRALGVNSTPTVFINGKRIREKTKESLKAAIDAALKDSAKK